MYQDYKDIAEFRLIYIREAHAADSDWPMPIATEKGIKNHQDFGQRCATAEMLFKDKQLTIPCLIDSMDDAANKAYAAWPDKIFVVRTDGRLAVAASQGPSGFKPAVDQTLSWLAEFKQTGQEPEPVSRDSAESPDESPRKKRPPNRGGESKR